MRHPKCQKSPTNTLWDFYYLQLMVSKLAAYAVKLATYGATHKLCGLTHKAQSTIKQNQLVI